MDLEYSTSSEGSSSASEASQESTRLEDCRIKGLNLKLPQGLCENKHIFKEFFSLSTWDECFTEQQKEHLKSFLPMFPENDAQEKEETLWHLFSRENMKFGSPLTDFFNCLKNGYYRPDIAKMRSLMRKAQFREYKYQQRRYYFRLMKEILLSRQKLLEIAFNQPPGTIPKMERIPQHTVPFISPAEQRTRRRYFQELAAVRQEVGESDHSSEDDNYPEGPPPRLNKKQKRQLASLESLLSPDMRHVTSTLALKPLGFDLEVNVTANHNPYEINEEAYKALLLNHKRRRMEGDEHPELNILGITTQDIEMRAQLSKRPAISRTGHNSGDQKVPKKRIKSEPGIKIPVLQGPLLNSPQPGGGESSNASDIDSDEEHSIGTLADEVERVDVDGDAESPVMTNKTPSSASSHSRTSTAAARNRRTNSSGSLPRPSKPSSGSGGAVRSLLQNRIKVESTEEESTAAANSIQQQVPTSTSIASNAKVQTPSFSNRQITAATLSDLDGIDMMNLPVDLDESPSDPMDISLDDIKPTPELMQETHACFFSLIRDVICSTPDHRMSLSTLEDRLKAWQENPISPLNDWYSIAADSWLLLLSSAVSFLCGDYPDAQPEDYVPYLEYKPQIQTYQWIGAGRDSDSHLQPLCQHWLDHRDEMTARPLKEEVEEEEVSDVVGEERAASPPPPRCPTTWVVRPSTAEEKEIFREQERLRYDNPHRAFTFQMHGYESVVGPVKGVYNQSIGANKPRGHSLLVAERPNFVTILALVRDATARLPNGEGTRTDICELLKDSQYLAPVAQESYLHSVVSGALDRLHYETDPCVKYDTKRKIWIYLHRGRTEEEFERLHQQQQGMAKTKKSSSQRKANRSKKENGKDAAASTTTTTGSNITLQQERTEATAVVCSSSGGLATNTSIAQTVVPVPVPSSNKPIATVARVARASMTPRTFTLATGQTVQNLQVSTSSGLHTIQVTTTPASLAGKSLLTAQAQQNLAVTAGSSVMKTMTATAQGVTASAGGQVLKAVTLTAQQMQAVNAARGITPTTTATSIAIKSSSINTASATSTIRMPISPLVGNTTATQGDNLLVVTKTSVATCGRATTSTVATSPTQASHVLQQLPLQSQQKATVKTTCAPSMPSSKSVVNAAGGAQVVNVSQVQLLSGKTAQPVLTAGGKTIVTAGLTGMKLVNAVKAIATSEGSQPQQQTIYIKQQKQQQQPLLLQQSQTDQQQTAIATVRQPQQIAPQQLLQKQVNKQQAASFSQLQQQMKQLQQQKQQQQQTQQTSQQPNTTTTTTATSVATSVQSQSHRVVTTMSVLGQGQAQQRVMARVGGKPIPVSHMTLPVQLQQQTPSTTGTSASTITTQQQQPMVAKVLTNAQGQVISMESLLAHQKQHGSLPQGTALRVTTAGKPGQTSLIQIPSTTPGGVAQFAVVSQGNLLSVGQPRVLQAQIPTQQAHSANAGGVQQSTVVTLQPQQQQQPNSKLVTATATTKPLVAGTATTATTNLRMLGPAAAGSLNLAHIGGKPVLLASKAQPTSLQAAPGQYSSAKSCRLQQQPPQNSNVETVASTTKPVVVGSATIDSINHLKEAPAAVRSLNPVYFGRKSMLLASKAQPTSLQAAPGQSHSANAGGVQQPTVVTLQPQQQQQPNSKVVTVTATTKPLVAGTATTASTNLRMLGPAAVGSLNLAHFGGKPVLLASKTQPTPLQGAPGQNVILTSQAAGGHQTVVLASQAIRAQGSTLVLQQGGAQQILLPPGFQSGTLNIKTLQGLQGLKVIPLSQTTAGTSNKGRQQVYARIISPGLRPATTNIIHQSTGGVPTAVTLQAASGDSGTTSSSTTPQQAGTGTSGSAEQ